MNVLLATDGSQPAKEGEMLVKSLFKRDIKINVFTVAPEPQNDWLLAENNLELVRMDMPVLGGDQIAAEAAERFAGEGFEADSSASRGAPGPEILRQLDKQGADVVVLGASHNTWMGNLLLGSVSTFVLHHAPCSVLIAHRAPTEAGTILFGADGSEHANAALSLATKLLDASRCSFHIATVVIDPWVSVAVYPPGPPFGSAAQYRKLERERMEDGWRVVERASTQLRERGFKVEGAVLAGNTTHQLLKESDNIAADLVVVGSRGLGPVRRTLLGSVSDQLVRYGPATLVGRFT